MSLRLKKTKLTGFIKLSMAIENKLMEGESSLRKKFLC